MSPQETLFIAPTLRDGWVKRRRQLLKITAARAGWWCCRVLNTYQAEIVEEATPWQRGEYLTRFPLIKMILLERNDDVSWLAMPYDPNEASARFHFDEPLLIHLTEGGRCFDVVYCRYDSGTLWYDDLDRQSDPELADYLAESLAEHIDDPGIANLGRGMVKAYNLLLEYHRRRQAFFVGEPVKCGVTLFDDLIRMRKRRERMLAQAQRQALLRALRLEERLRYALTMAGAHFLGYEETSLGLRVIWTTNGMRYSTIVANDLQVAFAGICLSGQDNKFDLTSVVSVILRRTR